MHFYKHFERFEKIVLQDVMFISDALVRGIPRTLINLIVFAISAVRPLTS